MADAVLKIKTSSKYVTTEPDYKLGYRGKVDAEGSPGRANLTALESIFAGSPSTSRTMINLLLRRTINSGSRIMC